MQAWQTDVVLSQSCTDHSRLAKSRKSSDQTSLWSRAVFCIQYSQCPETLHHHVTLHSFHLHLASWDHGRTSVGCSLGSVKYVPVGPCAAVMLVLMHDRIGSEQACEA